MLMDPGLSRQRAGVQHAIFRLQQEVTRPWEDSYGKKSFKELVPGRLLSPCTATYTTTTPSSGQSMCTTEKFRLRRGENPVLKPVPNPMKILLHKFYATLFLQAF